MQVQKVVVPELQSQQEEADTKMFLCAQFASTLDFQSVKIITVDSDLAILAFYFASKIKTHMYLEMGTGAKVAVYDITSHRLEHDICEALPILSVALERQSVSLSSRPRKNGLVVCRCLDQTK